MSDDQSKELGHREALDAVVQQLNNTVISSNEILKLKSLLCTYTEMLRKAGFPKDNIRGEKLLSKLQAHEISKIIALLRLVLEKAPVA